MMTPVKEKMIGKEDVDILKELIDTIIDEFMDIIHDDPSLKMRVTQRILTGAGLRGKIVKNLVQHLEKSSIQMQAKKSR